MSQHRSNESRHFHRRLHRGLAALALFGVACSSESQLTDEPIDTTHSTYQIPPPSNGTTCAITPSSQVNYPSSGTPTKVYYRYRPAPTMLNSTSGTIAWMDASTACTQAGGKLAAPTSSGENASILGLNAGQTFWVGLFQPWNQTAVNQNWQVGGTTIANGSYTNWQSGQPNDSDNVENNGQNCAFMYNTGTYAGQWNDWPCYQAYSYDYVCEFSSTPTSCSWGSACNLYAGGTTLSCSTCSSAANTSQTSAVNSYGCHVLSRTVTSCATNRSSLPANAPSWWSKFSCNVTFSTGTGTIIASATGLPDYPSDYFATSGDACYENWIGGNIHNPSTLSSQSYTISFPTTPIATETSMAMTLTQTAAVVGLAINGVPIYGNFAAGTDDIYLESQTFDRCGGHPESAGQYHYHTEPNAITYDDDNLVGVMRDGYPIYGRRDPNTSSYPADLDPDGGHTGYTIDSPSTKVYHYHVNLQTSAKSTSTGQQQWFLTTGSWHGTPGTTCTNC